MYTVPLPQSKINQSTRERIGEAVYLLAYLIGAANWETGTLKTTYEKITQDTGFPETTVKRWMAALASAGEISVKRVLGGSLITIHQYEAVARTRGVQYRPPQRTKTSAVAPDAPATQGPSADPKSSSVSPSADPKGPSASSEKTTSGLSNRPRADLKQTTGGLSNINKNMFQSTSQSTLQNAKQSADQNQSSHHSAFGFKSLADVLRHQNPRPTFNYRDPWKERVEGARAILDQLDEAERHQLLQTVMERMTQDPRPFVSGVVRRNDAGELEPKGHACEEIVLVHLMQYLENQEKAKASRAP